MTIGADTKEKRRIWMKKGSYKYLLQLLHGLKREIRELRKTQRYMIRGLEHEFLFDAEYILDIACRDEVDRAIIDVLRSAGEAGELPKDVANDLSRYKLNPWNVTQRIRRMNKRLDRCIAKQLAEKRGLRWALTSWAFQNLGATKEEINPQNQH
jgi:hypothetical protein